MGIIEIKNLVLTPKTKQWCALPYPRHPKGCPNYWGRCYEGGKIPIRMLHTIINTNKSMWIVYNEFDLEAHMTKMKLKHPNWSEAQLRNVYYWQNQSRAELKVILMKAVREIYPSTRNRPILSYLSGEGQGVNMYATCFNSGLELDSIKEMKICRHMVIIGEKLQGSAHIFTNRGAKREKTRK